MKEGQTGVLPQNTQLLIDRATQQLDDLQRRFVKSLSTPGTASPSFNYLLANRFKIDKLSGLQAAVSVWMAADDEDLQVLRGLI